MPRARPAITSRPGADGGLLVATAPAGVRTDLAGMYLPSARPL
jgi:hypothetical protein